MYSLSSRMPRYRRYRRIDWTQQRLHACVMSLLTVSQLLSLPTALATLEREAVSEGFGMISRLRKEWESGVNRFDREGELLLGIFRADRLLGISGLNRDPYINDPRVGRLRHLYVIKEERRTGIGRSLVQRLLEHATSNFDSVRLWTDRAASFYDALGFDRVDGPKVTHVCACAI
jgi:N-acetylglutamate synthase-like GNAT family acetyltransferase